MQKTVFSGIQPTGNLHIGNYFGAVRRWVKDQNNGRNIFCVVDMHAITLAQNPEKLREKSLELATILLAAGLDPEKVTLFIQSHNPDHANLAWVLNCIAPMGQMSRMTQYKEKSEGRDSVSVGLFDYPVLMAADILLYDTTHVPVGEDQKQHVELTRDLAEKFNSSFGETFVLPEPVIPTLGARIMSLQDPTKKMSKSDPNPLSRIGILDSKEEIRKKIMSAVTDSQNLIVKDAHRPGISNLIDLYAICEDLTAAEVEERFVGKGYGAFKSELAEKIDEQMAGFRQKYFELKDSPVLLKILAEGAKKAYEVSHPKLQEVYQRVGFVKHD